MLQPFGCKRCDVWITKWKRTAVLIRKIESTWSTSSSEFLLVSSLDNGNDGGNESTWSTSSSEESSLSSDSERDLLDASVITKARLRLLEPGSTSSAYEVYVKGQGYGRCEIVICLC